MGKLISCGFNVDTAYVEKQTGAQFRFIARQLRMKWQRTDTSAQNWIG